jgi:hypothetical protein
VKYGALKFIKVCLLVLGILMFGGGIIYMLSVLAAGHSYGLPVSYLITGFLPGIALMITGFLIYAMSEVLQLAIDIAENTAAIAYYGKETSEFFGRVSTKANPPEEPPEQRRGYR